jgi:Domain of unknown function (DUF4157)
LDWQFVLIASSAREDAVMFAPRVAKAPTKAAESPISKLIPQRSLPAHQRFGYHQGSAPENMAVREAPRGLSWDFSKISMSSPDWADRPQTSFPATAFRLPGLMQRKLAIGSVDDPLEHEADRVADQVMGMPVPQVSLTSAPPQINRKCASCEEEASKTLQPKRAGAPETAGGEAPGIVHEVLRSPGQALDAPTRAYMEPRFGRDFSGVRIHTDQRAQDSARKINASAYTVGQEVVFAAGRYRPDSGEGRKLLAHELSHTVQQSRSGGSTGSAGMSGAALGVHRQEASSQKPQEESRPAETTVFVSWDDLLNRKLTLPSLLQPRPQQPLLPSPGTLTLGSGPQTGSLLAPSSLFNFPPITSGGQAPSISPPSSAPSPFLPTPGPSSAQPAGPAPAAPSRLSVINSGRLSVGLRLGFPDLETAPGTPPSAAQQALQQGQILNQILTGQVPSAWQSLDKGKLAGALWGIFSTYIAPDVARKITSSLSGKAGPGGVSYELDAVLLTDFSGGGISFTLRL